MPSVKLSPLSSHTPQINLDKKEGVPKKEKNPEYTKYYIFQIFLGRPLAFFFWIFFLLIFIMRNSHDPLALLLAPVVLYFVLYKIVAIMLIPAFLFGWLLAFYVEKRQLRRNRVDIAASMFLAVGTYVLDVIFFIALCWVFEDKALISLIPYSFLAVGCGAMSTWILSLALPKDITEAA